MSLLVVACIAMSVAALLFGLYEQAGLGKNRFAVVSGAVGLVFSTYLMVILVVNRGARIRGYRNEIRLYHATPSRSRPMVQRVFGDPSEIEMTFNPDLGDIRPAWPTDDLSIRPPAFDSIVFLVKGPEGEGQVEVPAQLIRWDYRERFKLWQNEFHGS